MKKMLIVCLLLNFISSLIAQPTSKTSVLPQDKGMFYADVSPLFFASGGWGVAIGYEKKRIQSGLNFVGVKKLGGGLASGLFEAHTNLDVRDNLGAEWMTNYFFRPTRKGFYAGAILGYSQFNIRNIEKMTASTRAISVYGDLRAGYRWFPFKEYFYIDIAYGFSRKIASSSSNDYTFKSRFSFFPFMNVGVRLAHKD
jgi:hypothetical protein